jgi:hypothetical protein
MSSLIQSSIQSLVDRFVQDKEKIENDGIQNRITDEQRCAMQDFLKTLENLIYSLNDSFDDADMDLLYKIFSIIFSGTVNRQREERGQRPLRYTEDYSSLLTNEHKNILAQYFIRAWKQIFEGADLSSKESLDAFLIESNDLIKEKFHSLLQLNVDFKFFWDQYEDQQKENMFMYILVITSKCFDFFLIEMNVNVETIYAEYTERQEQESKEEQQKIQEQMMSAVTNPEVHNVAQSVIQDEEALKKFQSGDPNDMLGVLVGNPAVASLAENFGLPSGELQRAINDPSTNSQLQSMIGPMVSGMQTMMKNKNNRGNTDARAQNARARAQRTLALRRAREEKTDTS